MLKDRRKPYLTGERWGVRWDTSDEDAQRLAGLMSREHGRQYVIEYSLCSRCLVDAGPLEEKEDKETTL